MSKDNKINLEVQMSIETNSHEETFNIGKTMGELAKSGDIFCLTGDLGAGKTVFSKGFSKGLEIEDEITSPTFNIMNIYTGRLVLYHFDLYRLEDCLDIDSLGFDEFIYSQGCSLIEWAIYGKEILPSKVKIITITKDYTKHDDYRLITYDPLGDL